jgi:hypothetical protein
MLKRWPYDCCNATSILTSIGFLEVLYKCAWCYAVSESGLLIDLLQFRAVVMALKMLLLFRRFTMLLIHIQGR